MVELAFQPTSPEGLMEARASYRDIPANSLDGGHIVYVAPLDNTQASKIGVWWLVLDQADHRSASLHTHLFDQFDLKPSHYDRATDVERHLANLLVASRRLDIVNLVRQNDIIDYTDKGREHDEKLASTLEAIRARVATSLAKVS